MPSNSTDGKPIEYYKRQMGSLDGLSTVKKRNLKQFEYDFPGGGICKHCKRSCGNFSQFLRHISHSKICKESYDAKWIEDVKKAARNHTRRKSYHKLKGDEKTEDKPLPKKKQKYFYVKNDVKYSNSGRAFQEIFKEIFDESLEKAEEEIKKLAESEANSFLYDYAVEDAMDEAFKSMEIDAAFDFHDFMPLTEEELLAKGLRTLERVFERKIDERHKFHKENWSTRNYNDVVSGKLHSNALNKAFVYVYHSVNFEEKYEAASDIALDDVFLVKILDENCFADDYKLEDNLEKTYKSILKKELFKNCKDGNVGLNDLLINLMKDYLTKRFSKYDLVDKESQAN